MYGFTFVPDRDERFFAKQQEDDATKFVITEENEGDERDFNFIPSLLFSWLPAEARFNDFAVGFNGGLGYNLQRVAAFLGVGITYNENLTLSLGGTMHEQARLLGQYSEGDVVPTNLNRDQLHRETFRPNLYFGISFRLGRDPFAPAAGSGGQTGKQPEEVEENKAPTPDEEAPEPTEQPFIDLAATAEGDTVLGFTVDRIEPEEDTTVLRFSGKEVSITGTYQIHNILGEQVPCVTLDKGIEALPRVRGTTSGMVCVAATNANLFQGRTAGDPVRVDFSEFRVTIQNDRPTEPLYEVLDTARVSDP